MASKEYRLVDDETNTVLGKEIDYQAALAWAQVQANVVGHPVWVQRKEPEGYYHQVSKVYPTKREGG